MMRSDRVQNAGLGRAGNWYRRAPVSMGNLTELPKITGLLDANAGMIEIGRG